MSATEPIVGWIVLDQERLPLGPKSPVQLPGHAHGYAIVGAKRPYALFIVLDPGSKLTVGKSTFEAAGVIQPGDTFRLSCADKSFDLAFVAAAVRRTAAELQGRGCSMCRRALQRDDPVVTCPGCGLSACTALCMRAGQCIRCGNLLEEGWL